MLLVADDERVVHDVIESFYGRRSPSDRSAKTHDWKVGAATPGSEPKIRQKFGTADLPGTRKGPQCLLQLPGLDSNQQPSG
jgi:hypothetical protein